MIRLVDSWVCSALFLHTQYTFIRHSNEVARTVKDALMLEMKRFSQIKNRKKYVKMLNLSCVLHRGLFTSGRVNTSHNFFAVWYKNSGIHPYSDQPSMLQHYSGNGRNASIISPTTAKEFRLPLFFRNFRGHLSLAAANCPDCQ